MTATTEPSGGKNLPPPDGRPGVGGQMPRWVPKAILLFFLTLVAVAVVGWLHPPPPEPPDHAPRLAVPVARTRAGGEPVGAAGVAAGAGHRAGVPRAAHRHRAVPLGDRLAPGQPGPGLRRRGTGVRRGRRELDQRHVRRQRRRRRRRRGDPGQRHRRGLRRRARERRPDRAHGDLPALHHRPVHLLPRGRRSPTAPGHPLDPARGTPAGGAAGLGDRHREDRRLHLLAGAAGDHQHDRALDRLRHHRRSRSRCRWRCGSASSASSSRPSAPTSPGRYRSSSRSSTTR